MRECLFDKRTAKATSLVFLLTFLPLGATAQSGSTPQASTTGADEIGKYLVYTNKQYGFRFDLPKTWKGYSIVPGRWTGTAVNDTTTQKPEGGAELSIRHPLWTKANPRQDIPIMIFTKRQWKLVEREAIAVSAAPIGPGELGRNSRYVFALPPRYNFAYLEGYQEVETIMAGHPLHPF
jgi:hypothetical protein